MTHTHAHTHGTVHTLFLPLSLAASRALLLQLLNILITLRG